MLIKFTIRDNDPISKEVMRDLASGFEGFRYCEEVSEADLVILDPETKDLSSFSISPETQIIIVSANEEHIRKVFNKGITDYIKEPLNDPQRFLNGLQKVTDSWSETSISLSKS